jgi:Mg2+ and Co2+ transporter CorA
MYSYKNSFRCIRHWSREGIVYAEENSRLQKRRIKKHNNMNCTNASIKDINRSILCIIKQIQDQIDTLKAQIFQGNEDCDDC